MTKIYKAAVIGAGQIAAGYDEPHSLEVLTHAHALRENQRMQCLGFFDKSVSKSQAAAQKWGGRSYGSLDQVFLDQPDIVLVCVPDEHHFPVLSTLCSYEVKGVICEKPATLKFDQTLEIMCKFRERKTMLAINYQRRYDHEMISIRDKFRLGSFGKFVCGSVIYSKGILHNGSHAVDILRFLFGEPLGGIVTARKFDYSDFDPTVAAFLNFKDGGVSFIAADEKFFSVFEIDLLFENVRYRFHHSGLKLEKFEVKDDPVFPGYKEQILSYSGDSGLAKALVGMTDDMVKFLDDGDLMEIDIAKVAGTQQVCETLATMAEHEYFQVRGKETDFAKR